MNGLIMVDDKIVKTGYFFDYDKMSAADLRDEYVTFVSYWEVLIYGVIASVEDKDIPDIRDVYNLGVDIDRILNIEDCYNEDFINTFSYIEHLYRIFEMEMERRKYYENN